VSATTPAEARYALTFVLFSVALPDFPDFEGDCGSNITTNYKNIMTFFIESSKFQIKFPFSLVTPATYP